jgi:hypothetical protein
MKLASETAEPYCRRLPDSLRSDWTSAVSDCSLDCRSAFNLTSWIGVRQTVSCICSGQRVASFQANG